MADGTLPTDRFRYYMLQDYLYLKDYVKIFAAILQKSDDFEQIRFLCGEMSNTIGETFRTHLPYMRRLGITNEEIERTNPHIDNSAYSHYMLCEAQSGDVLTGLVTLLNCSWSYAYIAEEMTRRFPNALSDERYGAWFAGYVSEEYRKTNRALIDRIDAARRLDRRGKDAEAVRDLRKMLSFRPALLGYGLRHGRYVIFMKKEKALERFGSSAFLMCQIPSAA